MEHSIILSLYNDTWLNYYIASDDILLKVKPREGVSFLQLKK